MLMENPAERRQYTRFDALNLSYVVVDDEGNIINEGMGRTLNVSEGGILLETHFHIDEGRNLTVTIAVEEELVDIRGKVVHASNCVEGLCQTGVQFSEITPVQRKVLLHFIDYFKENVPGRGLRVDS